LTIVVLLTGLLHVDWLDVRRSTRGFARLSEAHDRLETGDLNGAIELLTSISDDGSVSAPEVYTSLVRARISRNAPGDAQAVLETAEAGLRHHPGDPELLWYASAGRVSLRDWEAASRHLSNYLAQRPDDPRALFMAAASAYEQGDLVSADTWLTRAEALDGSNPLVLGLRQQLASAASQE
ncbi:MAG: tetratricopeptide repeat protein, partial [Candidatus Eisenbacteria sp.]|nr:tetratricopeptide repeat protein [Candidatus Eisenbacteria bacterium]